MDEEALEEEEEGEEVVKAGEVEKEEGGELT